MYLSIPLCRKAAPLRAAPGWPHCSPKKLSHLGRWGGRPSRLTFFGAGGTDFPRPTVAPSMWSFIWHLPPPQRLHSAAADDASSLRWCLRFLFQRRTILGKAACYSEYVSRCISVDHHICRPTILKLGGTSRR
jgi:hypothetical protein